MATSTMFTHEAPVVAYALRAPRPECPWLFTFDPVTGLVTAFISETIINSRRSHSLKRIHGSLSSACQAYQLNARSDLELRWFRGISSLWVARFESQRLSARE